MKKPLTHIKLDSAQVQRVTSNGLIIRVTAVLISDGTLLETDMIHQPHVIASSGWHLLSRSNPQEYRDDPAARARLLEIWAAFWELRGWERSEIDEAA